MQPWLLAFSVREFRGARQHIKDSHSWVTIASQDTPNQAASDYFRCAFGSGLAVFCPVGRQPERRFLPILG